MGRVLLAAPRGFCAGVDRAITTVQQALQRYGPPVYVRKQIVHNTRVVADLTRLGATFVDELDQVPVGSVVVFSAHGVAPEIYAQAAARNLRVIDAVCPLVTKVHREAQRFAAAEYNILLIGHAGHEEIEGTLGHAPGRIHLVDPAHPERAPNPSAGGKVAWLSQTTLAVDETVKAAAQLRQRFPQLEDPPSDDICYASQNRQEAVKAIAGRCGLVLVVGSANSANSNRLVDVALAHGAPAAYLIDSAAGLDPVWLSGVDTVGVTSGASAPEVLVTELLVQLAFRGFSDTEVITTVEEHLVFATPHKLRGDPGRE